MIMNVALRYY